MHINNVSNLTNASSFRPTLLLYPPDSRELWFIIGILSIITNSMLLFGISKAKIFRNLTTIIIGSSFVIGILFGGIYVLPRFAIVGYRKWGLICSLLPVLGSSFLLNYNLHQCLICFDRLIAVNWPVLYKTTLSQHHYLIAIGMIWTSSLLVAIVPVLTFRPLQISDCILYSSDTTAEEIFLYLLFFGCIFFPITVIVTFYAYIFYVIYMRKRKINQTNASISPVQYSIIRRKTMYASIQMATLTLVFLCMMLPYLLLFLIVRLRSVKLMSLPLYYFAQFSRYIAFAYPAINPLLYAYFVESIRDALFYRLKSWIYGHEETRSPPKNRYERASSMNLQRLSLRLVQSPIHQ
ncbi:Alpha-1A adrenergic receptor [Trichoplax sp. H2]|nr:Alpha-1A adrenergic receptor [Trichoplax sp. H2]|eukprot:RDD38815.1 Alpha-1A adrenergic receptor [Trichoplax sp. H2]